VHNAITHPARCVAAGLAIAALTLPAVAGARPLANPTAGPPPAAVQPNPDQRASALTSSLAGTTSKQDLRSPDARDAAAHVRHPGHTGPDPGIYVQPWELAPVSEQLAARSTSTGARPLTPAASATVADHGNGIEWATIALGIAGSLLAVGAIAALTTRRNRRQRALRATP